MSKLPRPGTGLSVAGGIIGGVLSPSLFFLTHRARPAPCTEHTLAACKSSRHHLLAAMQPMHRKGNQTPVMLKRPAHPCFKLT